MSVLIFFLLVFSCSNDVSSGKDADVCNETDYEDDFSDTDFDYENCLDEWEKADFLDKEEVFNFNISESKNKNTWIDAGNYQSMYFEVSENSAVSDIIVDDKGAIYILGLFVEGEKESFFKKINDDGSVNNYYFHAESTPFFYDIKKYKYKMPQMVENPYDGT
ncbi:MAG TPA: hypothetical protein PLY36_16400, partial [Spirochaetota bacterium]|nr:hypothetical protein [Spirochaetota bacterium]